MYYIFVNRTKDTDRVLDTINHPGVFFFGLDKTKGMYQILLKQKRLKELKNIFLYNSNFMRRA